MTIYMVPIMFVDLSIHILLSSKSIICELSYSLFCGSSDGLIFVLLYNRILLSNMCIHI